MLSSSNSHHAVCQSSRRCNELFILIAIQGDVNACYLVTTRSLTESFQIRDVFKTNCFNDDRLYFYSVSFAFIRISEKVCRRKKNNLYEFKTARRYATKTSFGLIHIFENKERSISGTSKNYDKFMPKVCRVTYQNIYKLSFSHSTMSFISLLSRSLEDHRQICTTYINAGIIYAVSHVRISFHI